MSCKPTDHDLYNMQMSEIKSVTDKDGKEQRMWVIRVPGGWVYVSYENSGMHSGAARTSVFVPEP